MLPSPPDPLPAEEIFKDQKPGIRHYLIPKPAHPPRKCLAGLHRRMDRILTTSTHPAPAATPKPADESPRPPNLHPAHARRRRPPRLLRLSKYYQNQKTRRSRRVSQAIHHNPNPHSSATATLPREHAEHTKKCCKKSRLSCQG